MFSRRAVKVPPDRRVLHGRDTHRGRCFAATLEILGRDRAAGFAGGAGARARAGVGRRGGPAQGGRRVGRRLLARRRLGRPVRRRRHASSARTASTRRRTRTAARRRTASSRACRRARSSSRARTASASRSSRTTSTSRRTCSAGAPRSCSRQGDSGIDAREPDDGGHATTTPRPTTRRPSWGVWAFQDVFDVRFYDYYAERMAAAVEQARRRPRARCGSAPSVSQFDKTHRHSFGPAIADDGTPAGYPHDDTDHDLTVVRFDDVSDPANPKPLANLVNFALHPEFLEGNDLISADYLGAARADDRPRDRRDDDLHPGRRRHGRARAQHLPLDPRAARVHATASTRRPSTARG